VTLIAVSKVQPPERVEAVLREGHRVFGENRVQEAQGRWPDFLDRYDGIELHLIGPLQTNKARAAVEMFGSIHTVDRPKLAKTLARLAQERGKAPRSSSRSTPGRSRRRPGAFPSEVDGFVAEVRALDLPLRGLMCIPPVDEEASLHFALLAKTGGAQRPYRPVDGHECRFREGDRLRRDACPRRLRHFRRTGIAGVGRDLSRHSGPAGQVPPSQPPARSGGSR
jgi:uncharacterized pyridoxal phosphate-containing UPF0001 family protein